MHERIGGMLGECWEGEKEWKGEEKGGDHHTQGGQDMSLGGKGRRML